MDFSTAIQNRKKLLKPTKTVLTNYLGEKYELEQFKSKEKIGEGFAFVVDTAPDLQVAHISLGIYLSAQDPVFSIEILKNYQITDILSVGIDPPIKFPKISYHFVEILDIPEFNLADVLEDCLNIIRKSKNILVHCNAGISRSPTIVIAYLMQHEKLTFEEAFDKVKRVRSCIKPNEGFIKQLKLLTDEPEKN